MSESYTLITDLRTDYRRGDSRIARLCQRTEFTHTQAFLSGEGGRRQVADEEITHQFCFY